MDFGAIYEISASGMDYEQMRLKAIALNLANSNSTRSSNGQIYKPLEAVARVSNESVLAGLNGVSEAHLVEKNVETRKVFKPSHPDADVDGFIHMPNINPIDEMTNLMMATRAYEANVRVMNAAKSMAAKAMSIGE